MDDGNQKKDRTQELHLLLEGRHMLLADEWIFRPQWPFLSLAVCVCVRLKQDVLNNQEQRRPQAFVLVRQQRHSASVEVHQSDGCVLSDLLLKRCSLMLMLPMVALSKATYGRWTQKNILGCTSVTHSLICRLIVDAATEIKNGVMAMFDSFCNWPTNKQKDAHSATHRALGYQDQDTRHHHLFLCVSSLHEEKQHSPSTAWAAAARRTITI